MVITTAGTSEKSGTLAKRKPRHCIFMHSCLRFSPFGGRTTGIIARKWRLIDLNYWLYFYCGFIYWAKVAQKTAFRADSLWEMGQRCSIKGSRFTGTNIRCNTLQLEIQHVASFGSNAVHLSIQHVAMRDTMRCMPLLNTLSHPFRWQLVLHSSHKDAGCLFSRQK